MVRVFYLIKASLLTARRYSVDWWGSIILPLVNLIPFLVAIFYAQYVGWINNLSSVLGTNNLILYYLVGIVYWNYVESLWVSVMTLRYYMRIGLFEDIFALPITAFEYIIAWALLELFAVTVSSAPLIIIATALLLLNTGYINFLFCILVFFASILASFGFAFVLFGATLIFKEGDEIISLIGNSAPFLGGLYFPVSILSKPLELIGLIFPFSWGLDLIRFYSLGTTTILPNYLEHLVFIFICCVYLVGGIITYRILEIKARRKGIQGF